MNLQGVGDVCMYMNRWAGEWIIFMFVFVHALMDTYMRVHLYLYVYACVHFSHRKKD